MHSQIHIIHIVIISILLVWTIFIFLSKHCNLDTLIKFIIGNNQKFHVLNCDNILIIYCRLHIYPEQGLKHRHNSCFSPMKQSSRCDWVHYRNMEQSHCVFVDNIPLTDCYNLYFAPWQIRNVHEMSYGHRGSASMVASLKKCRHFLCFQKRSQTCLYRCVYLN